ncbi:DUF4292 domain-containing protein [Sphingobacterium bovistauri]|uniref:DUF4292 domain-containing protein n=1 Tax=Sphingobacterium bovistauri TaxID=2781959 RepID=A0ABS7Z721_9SPHI|nr:DUF4292 domain-containing protein [Sphingobacterium bovistauri]MCA5005945.1 DUF4292 domain-containing protein [Sphingobacterium bovistauri]
MWNKILILGIVISVFVSCGTRKNKSNRAVSNDVVTNKNSDYLINNLDYHTFSGRAKAKVELGKDNQDVTLHVRVQRNKAIWISVTATFLNVEGARLLITPDSVKIMNKLQGEYIVKPFDYIRRYTGEGVNFGVLQDLLVANVSSDLLRTDQITVAQATDDVQLAGVKNDLSFQYSLNDKYRPKVIRLTPIGGSQSLESFYSSFNDVAGYNFPQNQNIKLTSEGFTVNAILNYNKAEFNQELEMPFSVPAKYKVLK